MLEDSLHAFAAYEFRSCSATESHWQVYGNV